MIASFFYPYGANRNVKIFIGSDDPDTRKEFSELCGQKKVKNFSVNTNVESSASGNTGASNQPLITVGMLERINGDEKGDAIVSVRGYEPIWSRFTPSYELEKLYFQAGKADKRSREAVLFDKSEYVFDIAGGKAQSERDKILDELEKSENEKNSDSGNDEQRLAQLDKEWMNIECEVRDRLKRFCLYGRRGRGCGTESGNGTQSRAAF